MDNQTMSIPINQNLMYPYQNMAYQNSIPYPNQRNILFLNNNRQFEVNNNYNRLFVNFMGMINNILSSSLNRRRTNTNQPQSIPVNRQSQRQKTNNEKMNGVQNQRIIRKVNSQSNGLNSQSQRKTNRSLNESAPLFDNNINFNLNMIRDEIDLEKNREENNKLSEDLSFTQIIGHFINKTIKYYSIPFKRPNSLDFIKKRFLVPYFNNEIIDENYFDNFNCEKAIKKVDNSIMYKKNKIKDDEEENLACTELFFFCKGKNFLEFQNNQNNGIGRMKIIFLFALISILSFNIFSENKFKNVKVENSIKKKYEQKIWNEAIGLNSFEYNCIFFNIHNCSYDLHLTCREGQKFYRISRFGFSPPGEEGHNIASCFSKTFKNLINIDEYNDYSEELNFDLIEYRYEEVEPKINIYYTYYYDYLYDYSIKNNRDIIFLSYSCYIPYIKYDNKKITRKEFIMPIIKIDAICYLISYLILFLLRFIFYRSLDKSKICIKDLTLMIDTINIPRERLPYALNDIIKSINKILLENLKQYYNDFLFPFKSLKEINYSFIDYEEKKLYKQLNLLLRKKIYLEKNHTTKIKKSFIFEILFRIFHCIKIFNKNELEETEKEIKKLIIKLIKRKDSEENIRKIYITFHTYKEKQEMKKYKIVIENEYHNLKNADMSPHEINWENLNVSKENKLLRIVISIFLLISLIFSYFLIILLITKVKISYEKYFNLNTDCSNLDYKNNNELIYLEYSSEKSNEEKIYTYCYCQSDLNGNEILYNNIRFDPCENYNKYKYIKNVFIYIITIILFILSLGVEFIVNKIIKIQRLESKSNQINLNIIISTIILLFADIISVILINAKLSSNKVVSFFIFGQIEDINPDWIYDINECISYAAITNMAFKMISVFVFVFIKNEKLKKCLQKINLFLTNDQVSHFYKFYKNYVPEKDYASFSIFFLFSLFEACVLICSPSFNTLLIIFMMCQSIMLSLVLSTLSKQYKFSFTFYLNENYFRIMFIFTNIIIIIHYLMGIWWYSSEYFFIDIDDFSTYEEFSNPYSHYELIEIFLSGKATISGKIKAKLLMKRNLWFIIPIVVIIFLESVMAIFQIKNCKKQKEFEENPLNIEREDMFTHLKICELYGLLYFKTKLVYLKNNPNFKDLVNFISYKYSWHSNHLNNEIPLEKYDKILILKNQLIKKNEEDIDKDERDKAINFRHLDSTFSPFLLDRYTIPFYSKFLLSPYYN